MKFLSPLSGLPTTSLRHDELDWIQIPGLEGPLEASFAFLWGNPMTGPSGFFLRLPAGGRVPWHTHSGDYHAVVLSGALQVLREGAAPDATPRLGPGAYHFQRGGEAHREVVVSDEDLVAYVQFFGPNDLLEIEGG